MQEKFMPFHKLTVNFKFEFQLHFNKIVLPSTFTVNVQEVVIPNFSITELEKVALLTVNIDVLI
jgi:hypothetical protein